MTSFAGKAVLISGASEGIGRALALMLAAERPRLALNARNAARLEETSSECRALGAEVLTVPADVSQREACTQLVAHAVERFGRLDALVNNAGITMWSRFDAVSDFGMFERLLAVNYLGAVYLTAAALPHLKHSRGLIVAVASLAGLTGIPERTGYAASKHALVGFFESLRIELRGSGVDVTLVAPDFVLSEAHRRAAGSGCSSLPPAAASCAGRASSCLSAWMPSRRARSASAAEPHSKAIAGRSSATRKYSNRYLRKRIWLCSR